MNYIIEDNVDFFAELSTALTSTENNEVDSMEQKWCLITHMALEKHNITLPCGHTFNYLALYNEVGKQKSGSILETAYLSINQIKCPYCRTITNKLLPYISHPEVGHKRGVNFPTKYCMKLYKCDWLFTAGKKAGCKCGIEANSGEFGNLCNRHQLAMMKKINMTQKTENIIENWTAVHEELYRKHMVEDLKKLLRIMKLPVTGNKKILVHRLINGPAAPVSDTGVIL